MNKRDWKRLRTRIEALGKKRREFSAVGWASAGIVMSSVFTGFTWAPAHRSMELSLQVEFAWVWPAVIALGLAALVVAVLAFVGASALGRDERASAGEIVEDMDEIFDPTKPESSGELLRGWNSRLTLAEAMMKDVK